MRGWLYLASLLWLQAVACNGGPASAAPDAVTPPFSFESAPVGAVPQGWRVAETNGRGMPAEWQVAASEVGGRVLRVVTSNSGATYNVVLLSRRSPADLELSVRVRADSGTEDRGGGLLWRARDAANYYITRWNPLEDNLRAYKVVDSVRTQLASADIRTDPAAWHELGVRATGSHITVHFDGDEVLSFEDETFGGGGFVGLWTKADASTSFDDLEIAAVGAVGR